MTSTYDRFLINLETLRFKTFVPYQSTDNKNGADVSNIQNSWKHPLN